MKFQIPSTKLQTNLKFQYSMTKTGLEFGTLVIVICLIFVICDLEFYLLLGPVSKIPQQVDKQFNPLEQRIFYNSFIF